MDPAARVLVADDEEDIRLLVSLAVRRAGCTLLTAVADGAQALAATRTERPDLVVLDVSMPELTGLEVCAELRADPATAGTRVLLLSAGASPDDVARGLAAGADAYLPKPF
ncbi:response regulator, partial [Modestobacter sp. VKM Ac-2676]